MTDRTGLFRSSVKTIRTRNKALGVPIEPNKNTILPPTKQKHEFTLRIKDVVNNITKLRDFLLEHRRDYISSSGLLLGEAVRMTDTERDQIDCDAQAFMRTCSEAIRSLKSEVVKQSSSNQVKEHYDVVFQLVDNYLKSVCKLYSEQRAIRVKRSVDKRNMSKLAPEHSHTSLVSDSQQTECDDDVMAATNGDRVSKRSGLELENTEYDHELSPEELQMFEQENLKLFNDMNSLVDDVRNIEGRVMEITKLQEIFADKVLQQESEVDRISESVVKTTEDVKEGNEEIREAIKSSAGFRVYILFFFIMCTFSLLFLDWYNS